MEIKLPRDKEGEEVEHLDLHFEGRAMRFIQRNVRVTPFSTGEFVGILVHYATRILHENLFLVS